MGTEKKIFSGLDPRIKLITFFSLMSVIILTPYGRTMRFVFYFCILAAIHFFASLRFREVFRRILLLIPLMLFFAAALIISPENDLGRDIEIFLDLSIKSGLCFLCVAYFSLTTDFFSLIKGLQAVKFPHLFSGIMLFGYNYGFLLAREVKRIQIAKESRSPNRVSKTKDIRLAAHLAPMLIYKTLERSEKIYAAMLSRGFKGELRGLKKPVMSYEDVVFVCLFAGLLISGTVFL